MKRVGEVEQGPRDNDDIVNIGKETDRHHSETDAFEEWTNALPDRNGAGRTVLAHCHLKKKDRNASQKQTSEVRNEESACENYRLVKERL